MCDRLFKFPGYPVRTIRLGGLLIIMSLLQACAMQKSHPLAATLPEFFSPDHNKQAEQLVGEPTDATATSTNTHSMIASHGANYGLLADLQNHLNQITEQASQGDTNAQLNLAQIYWRVKNYDDALTLYNALADKGNAIAQYQLGYAYQQGLGVDKSHTLAQQWYKKAADQNNLAAITALNQLMLQNNHAAVTANKKQIRNQKKTVPLAVAKSPKIKVYHDVQPKSPTTEKTVTKPQPLNDLSVAELTKLAESGDQQAQFQLSVVYLEGKDVPQNYQLSAEWAHKAALQGNAAAQNNLGAAYTHGNGVEKNEKLAFEWYEKAAEQGYPLAQYNLAASYAMGAGTKKDYTEAYAWFVVLQNNKNQTELQKEQGKDAGQKLVAALSSLSQLLTSSGQMSNAQILAKQYLAQFSLK